MIVGILEHRSIQTFLAAKVVVDHPLHRVGALGDLIDTSATQALGRELPGGNREDFSWGGFCIPLRGSWRSPGTACRRKCTFCLEPLCHRGKGTEAAVNCE